MTDNTQPEALMQLADAYAEASFDQGLHKRTLDDAPENARSVLAAAVRSQHARIAELESQLAQRFDAADMATAAAQGFRDGVASVSAGSEPVTNNRPSLEDVFRRLSYRASHGQAPSGAGMGHTDGGRNMFYEGRFDGESQREQQARLRWANDMRAAFERHTGNGWFDKDWRTETGLWSSAWHACLAAQPTTTAQAADSVLEDAARYRWLRIQDSEDFEFAVVKNPHFDVFESPEELDAAIDAAMNKGGAA